MADANDFDGTADWFDDRSRTDSHAEPSRIEVFTDTDPDTVTFAWNQRGDDETTTAWITAEVDLVVSGSDMQ